MADSHFHPITIRSALQAAIAELGGDYARRDAETLLLHLLGKDRVWLRTHPDAILTEAQNAAFSALLRRRAAQEPVQYIRGHQEFFGLDLLVTPAVLIPRPETELLVEAVLHWATEQTAAPLRLVDVGTGSGAIACALALRLPQADILALDISSAALAVARHNADRLGLAGQIHFLGSDLLAACPLAPGSLDCVVSNPPYVPTTDAASLEPQVRDFEPHTALFAGSDGLDIYRRLLPQAWEVLRPGGLLALEFGYGQADAILDLLQPWSSPTLHPDLAGIPRMALALKPRAALALIP